MDGKGDPTVLLQRWQRGDKEAGAALWEGAYASLQEVARALSRHETTDSLSSTGLLHAAWEKLERGVDRTIVDTSHYRALLARAMRQVLVDHARRRLAAKRGGRAQRQPLDDILASMEHSVGSVIDLHDALDELSTQDSSLAGLIEMRFFGELSIDEIAGVTSTSTRTVERGLASARGWLYRRLRGTGSS